MKPAVFERAAHIEQEKARLHYERVQEGLGDDFEACVDEAVQRIKRDPAMYRRVWRDYRRCLMQRFPYGIIYEDLPDCIHIVGVSDLRRAPDRWKSRV